MGDVCFSSEGYKPRLSVDLIVKEHFDFENEKGDRPEGQQEGQQERVGIYLTDGMAYTLGVNQYYEELTEIMEDEVRGRHMHVLEEEGFFNQSVTLMVLRHRTPITIEQTIRTGKKNIVTGNPIFDNHGNIVMVLSTNVPKDRALWSSSNKVEKITEPVSCYFPAMPGLVASSRTMQQVLMRAARIASFDSTVLIQGETGVGKAVIAEFIHRMSQRRAYPFINVNMAAIPKELLESELFGYKGGAFTGALKSGKSGLIQAAEGGTLFLDEIAELPLSNQAKLLHILQEKEVLPLGSATSQRVNVRFIAATNRNLQEMVLTGKFREDLFYRLNVAPIYIPPLRERKEDIFNLAQYFLAEITSRYKIVKRLSSSALQVLTDYNWPGNVRELQNLIERVILLYPQKEITREHIFRELALKAPLPIKKVTPSLKYNLQEGVAAFEKEILQEALRHYNGNLQMIADVLEIHRTTLFRKLRKYKLV